MPSPPSAARLTHFGTFEVDLRSGELRKQGLKIKLQEKPFQILAILVGRPGDLVTRDELRQALWGGDTFVDFDHGIDRAIKKLREALGDSHENPRFIETLPRRGYRFIYPVNGGEATTPQPAGVTGELEPAPMSLVVKTAPLPMRRNTRQMSVVAFVLTLTFAIVALLAFNVAGVRDRIMRAFGSKLARPIPSIKSIAVLPLENLSRDPEQEFFSDGMTEEIITELAKIRSLRVISRTSVMPYKKGKKPISKIARELGVDSVVEGAVLRSGNRIRINAQLIQAKPEKHLWAHSYERDLGDVLALQSEVARTITQQIEANLTPQEEKRISTVRRLNPQALEHYLRGRYAIQRMTERDLKEAVSHFQKAIELDPNYAQAYAGLAAAYYWMSNMWLPSNEAMPKSKAAALRALELDENLGEAHASLALVLSQYEWDWSGARNAYRRAIELSPSSAFARTGYGIHLASMGEWGEAAAELNNAAELDPFSEGVKLTAFWPLYYGRRYDEGVPRLQKLTQTEPESSWAHFYLGQAYEGTGRCDKALEEYGKAQQMTDHPHWRAVMIGCLQKLERYDKAQEAFTKLKELERTLYVSHYTLAVAYTNLNQKDRALKELETAYEERCEDMVWLRSDPEFDSLRPDPRFQALLHRMNFPP